MFSRIFYIFKNLDKLPLKIFNNLIKILKYQKKFNGYFKR